MGPCHASDVIDLRAHVFQALAEAQRKERELRAAAAERRLQANGRPEASAPCAWCGKDLAGTVPFTRLEHSYCSTPCVSKHREALDEIHTGQST